MVIVEINGSRKQPGAIRVSDRADAGVAVVADLERGLPFRNESVGEIYLDHTLEDVRDLVAAMQEVWRICSPGALVHVWLPHASSSWASSRNPGQTRPFTIETFEFFDPGKNPDHPAGAVFEIEQAKLYLTTLRQGQRPRLTGGVISSVFESLANRSRGTQYRWERWLGGILGFEEFYILLSAVKTPAWEGE